MQAEVEEARHQAIQIATMKIVAGAGGADCDSPHNLAGSLRRCLAVRSCPGMDFIEAP